MTFFKNDFVKNMLLEYFCNNKNILSNYKSY